MAPLKASTLASYIVSHYVLFMVANPVEDLVSTGLEMLYELRIDALALSEREMVREVP